ncbi:MAG: hypothetical protein K2G55_21995 [Lachnospiraceae bacterium]|nr:hypothetical protein [Lachnospiraceae bacterium]MDE7202358.1 hypothetical protein [Lachnospiraceae bacterium]
MSMEELKESIVEQILDAINITHLLTEELTSNEDDSHIIRSVGIIGKILDGALENLKQLDV